MPTTGWSGEEKRRSRQYLGSWVPVRSRNTAYCALVTGVSPSQNGERRTGWMGCSSRYTVPPISNRPPGIQTNRMRVEGSTRVPCSPGSAVRSVAEASAPVRAWLSSATAWEERPPRRSTEAVTRKRLRRLWPAAGRCELGEDDRTAVAGEELETTGQLPGPAREPPRRAPPAPRRRGLRGRGGPDRPSMPVLRPRPGSASPGGAVPQPARRPPPGPPAGAGRRRCLQHPPRRTVERRDRRESVPRGPSRPHPGW